VQREFARMVRLDQTFEGMISISVRGLPLGQYKITRLNLDNDVGTVTINPWEQWHEIPAHSGGFIGEVIATPEPKILQEMNIRHDPVLGDRLTRFGSCFVNPLYDAGEALNWSITLRLSPTGYTPDDVITGLLRGNIIGRMTKTLVVAKEVRTLNTKLQDQLERIARIQRALLPERLPALHGLSIATAYLTSHESGGDYYDFFDIDRGRMGFIVADVSGHGAGAATVMAMLQTILHGFQERHKGPAAILEHDNRELLRKPIESIFVTAFYGVVDRERHSLTYSNAGHNHPERRFPTGETAGIDGAASVPLGIVERPMYENATIDLAPGQTIVAYTDGITEAFSPPPAREMFGRERLREALAVCSGEPACVIETLHQRLIEHTRTHERADDQTIVAMRVEP
jgi:sigma-B regulation protein RsbU (phosphoserine phosphatase)